MLATAWVGLVLFWRTPPLGLSVVPLMRSISDRWLPVRWRPFQRNSHSLCGRSIRPVCEIFFGKKTLTAGQPLDSCTKVSLEAQDCE